MAKYVIVGNGVTGTRAAEVIRRADGSADVSILTEEPHPFYRRPQLADFASGAIGETRMWVRKASFYEDHRLDLRLSTKVVAVDVDSHLLTLADGATVPYDRLLVATGRYVTSFGVPGGEGGGINHFKTLDEARTVREFDAAGKTGVVFGNGMVALELVRALTSAGFSTTYLVPTDTLWPEALDKDAADIAVSRLHAAGARVVFGARIGSVATSGGCGGEVSLADGDVLRADFMGLCSDLTPAVDFLPGGGAGLVVGLDFSTPWADVYAAGDVTAGEGKSYFNWLRSWRQGEAAGAAMVGDVVESQAAVDTLNMQVLGLSLVALGRTVVPYRSADSEMRGDYPYGEFYKKLVFSA
ncbi:MAG TPA: FAD-dependent oxidoreductase, partial [Thermoleophilia bacterium]|nr:FAD-dependent oxidoreductase [Thermoleophilia bacterium]